MRDLTLKARLARLECLANQAKQDADNLRLEGSTVVYWNGVEAAYRTAIQIIKGNDPYC